ncbi:MAG: symmetrical bis(5'-nucleosyl)-tetraphosphatase [Gammaproteobacteria bacterium]|nr:symmetrical bis(5'-nucleosyl)-tetraphosphatase [Gammaproteobacteria bacterium]
MAVWAIGDIQGCYGNFLELLDLIEFDPAHDTLWLTGDLVNRGPDNLATLRFVRELGDAAITVLGNHDLALLVTAAGHRDPKSKDTIDDILAAPDRDELLDWLAHRPMAHFDAELDCLMVHAGLPPQWDIATTMDCAHEVEAALQGPRRGELLGRMFGNEPDLWHAGLADLDRWRFTINALTRMRYVDADGRLDFSAKGPPGSQPDHLYPWYAVPQRASAGQKMVIGHWSALGQEAPNHPPPEIHALDTGCLWGGKLTALRLDQDAGAEGARRCIDCDTQAN